MTSPVRNPVREAAEAAWAREAAVRPTVEKLAAQYTRGMMTAGELANEILTVLVEYVDSETADARSWRTDSEWF